MKKRKREKSKVKLDEIKNNEVEKGEIKKNKIDIEAKQQKVIALKTVNKKIKINPIFHYNIVC